MGEGSIMTEKTTGPATSEQPPQETRASLKEQLKKIADKLNKLEDQKRSGVRERLPKARMLDATALEEKDKDHHYRYVNTDDPGGVQVMVDDGYQSVPAKECEDAEVRAEVGELRLMRIPREQHEEEVARQKELAKSRLVAHKTEVRSAVEAVQRELRDRHGIDVPLDRLLVDE
jgi:hypothetical protein